MFLDRLDALMSEKQINKSILSKETGIPYTTIDSFYKKGYENTKLSTLRKLCDYFGVSLDFLIEAEVEEAKNEVKTLSRRELKAIKDLRSFDDLNQQRIYKLIDDIKEEIKKDEKLDMLIRQNKELIYGRAVAYGGETEDVSLDPEEDAKIEEYMRQEQERIKKEGEDIL